MTGFVAALIGTGILAVAMVVFHVRGDLALKVLLTTLSIGVYSLLSLCCSLIYPQYRLFSLAGLAFCGLGLLFALLTNWEIIRPEAVHLLKFRFVFLATAMAAASSAMMLRVRVLSAPVAFSRIFAILSIWATTGIVVFLLFGYEGVSHVENWIRVSAVTAICGLVGLIVTPLLKRIQSQVAEKEVSPGGPLALSAIILSALSYVSLQMAPVIPQLPNQHLSSNIDSGNPYQDRLLAQDTNIEGIRFPQGTQVDFEGEKLVTADLPQETWIFGARFAAGRIDMREGIIGMLLESRRMQWNIAFKPGKVSLYPNGYPHVGRLREDTVFDEISWSSEEQIEFAEDRIVLRGILAQDTRIRGKVYPKGSDVCVPEYKPSLISSKSACLPVLIWRE